MLSAEGWLLLAVLEVRCRQMRPKERTRFLVELTEVMERWENAPSPIKGADGARARATAAAMFKSELPRLLG